MDDAAVVPLVAAALPAHPGIIGPLRAASSWHGAILEDPFLAALCSRARHHYSPIATRALAALERTAEDGVATLGRKAAMSLAAMVADRQYMIRAVQLNVRVVRHRPSDREVVLAALRKTASALRYAAPELQADREIVLAAVRKDPDSLKYAASELQADREIVLEALRKDASSLMYAAPELRADPKIILEASRRKREQLPYSAFCNCTAVGPGR